MSEDIAELHAEKECDKYTRMWAQTAYTAHSPGRSAVPDFQRVLVEKWPHARKPYICDVGCGRGDAITEMMGRGVVEPAEIFALDIVDLNPPVPDGHFMHGPIWDPETWITHTGPIPPVPLASMLDILFCVDVLEHLPTELVVQSLETMRAHCLTGAFLRIALYPDGCGKLIGETLHLTVKPAEWWIDQLGQCKWRDIEVVDQSRKVLTVWCKPG